MTADTTTRAAPKTTEDMIARLPFRIKDGGWTTQDVSALETGRVDFDHFMDPAARIRLCTAAGYFNVTLVVTGPVEKIPAFEIVPTKLVNERGFGTSITGIHVPDDKYIEGLLRGSASWSRYALIGGRIDADYENNAEVMKACNGPIERSRGWLIQTETGGVVVFGATKDAFLDIERDGVKAFLATPGVIDTLKR